ncbi:MAG: hypothetical protein PW788_04835 [Micavibrio sp.]|nr:hypothetical protein [Micavibrio sp.]
MNAAKSNTMKKVEEILRPGTLAEKQEQIDLFISGGHSMLYSGDVAWKMTLKKEDKVVKGDAPSLDEAFSQMRSVMAEILKHTSPDSPVALAVKEKP